MKLSRIMTIDRYSYVCALSFGNIAFDWPPLDIFDVNIQSLTSYSTCDKHEASWENILISFKVLSLILSLSYKYVHRPLQCHSAQRLSTECLWVQCGGTHHIPKFIFKTWSKCFFDDQMKCNKLLSVEAKDIFDLILEELILLKPFLWSLGKLTLCQCSKTFFLRHRNRDK